MTEHVVALGGGQFDVCRCERADHHSVETLPPSRGRGRPRYQVVVEGMTYKADVSPRGDNLHIEGPLENKRPLKAMYSLRDAEVVRWPEFYGHTKTAKTRQRRFNTAAWALIDEATNA